MNKTALITGIANNKSIAFGIAEEFSKAGYYLIVTYQNDKSEKFTKQCANELNFKYHNVIDFVRYEYGNDNFDFFDALGANTINCVVHAIAFAQQEALNNPVVKLTRDGFLHAMEYSCYSLIDLVQGVNGAIVDGGSVFTLSYIGADRAVQGYNVMGIAKSALQSTVRYLALDLADRGIRVNSVSPGPIKTRAANGIRNIDNITKLHNRVGDSANISINDIGRLVLTVDNIQSINGQNILLDNGFSVLEPVVNV